MATADEAKQIIVEQLGVDEAESHGQCLFVDDLA